jgi:hypothetical protein
VKRGEILLDLRILDRWNDELERINAGKEGGPAGNSTFMNELLIGCALGAFNDYTQGFRKHECEPGSLEAEHKKTGLDKDLEIRYEKEKRDLEDKNKRLIEF